MVHCHQRLGPDRWSFCPFVLSLIRTRLVFIEVWNVFQFVIGCVSQIPLWILQWCGYQACVIQVTSLSEEFIFLSYFKLSLNSTFLSAVNYNSYISLEYCSLKLKMPNSIHLLSVCTFSICNANAVANQLCSFWLQATMFNDANNDSDVLVASDAIGMGLNLNISRIIFSTLTKFDGVEMRDLSVPEIKQIAGIFSSLSWSEMITNLVRY